MVYNDLFHVHTKRCLHAGNASDEDYIKKAVFLGASSVFFTDHAPFPGDILGNRMQMDELSPYYYDLLLLKQKYAGLIDVKIGLEIEYFPQFLDYYRYLTEAYQTELFLGQHVYYADGKFSFERNDGCDRFLYFTDAICRAMQTGMFKAILHPERIYRNTGSWDQRKERSAKDIWNLDCTMEVNYASRRTYPEIWENFWKYKSKNPVLYGLDAHSPEELAEGTLYFRKQ